MLAGSLENRPGVPASLPSASFDASQFIGQYGLEQIKFPGEISVQRFLADPQFLRQIIHGHTAEAVTEEVSPGSIDDPLAVDVVLSALRPVFAGPFHVRGYFYHNAETNPVYLVSSVQPYTRSRSEWNWESKFRRPSQLAVLDLNGDGKLEVIVHSFYYEGGQTTIYRCDPDKVEPVLSVECGA